MERKAQELIPLQVFPAQVKEVDENNRTCTVRVNDNVDLYEVKLYAVTDKDLKGFCLIPAQDSQVLVARIANGNDLFVCSFSVVDKVVGTIGDNVEIAFDADQLHYKNDKTEMTVKSNDIQVKTEKVTFTASDSKVTVDADEVVFNGGNNAGMVNIVDITKKINDLVKSFNDHTHTISTISVPANGLFAAPNIPVTGSATAADVAVPAPDAKASILQKGDYEDTKIKH